ncbi:MAG: hypothetical protein FIA96_07600, partial [Betaproteobacteria bacterium]|nr:hypothetical protein [Betaproteobacteria bacterium]
MVTTAPAKVSLAFVRRGVLLLLLILSLPWSTGNFLGTLVSVSWAAIAAYLLTAVVASRLILTAIIAAAFVLMYSQGLGDAIADGTTAAGFSVSEEDILSSVAGLVLFLAVLALTSVSTRNFCRRYIASRREGIIGQRDFEVALVVFLGLCFAAAVATETWSYWGDKEIRIEETGGVRLELFYPPALFVIWGFGALKWLDGTSRSPWSYSYSIVGVISVLLMFALQSRRLMLAVALLVALVMFYSTTHRALHSLALKVGTVVLILVLFTAGSSGWRDLDAYGEAATLSQRVEGAFKALVDPRSMEGIGSRLNYLSFDAMSHDLRQGYGVEADGVGLFLSELAIAIPRVIFSGKNEVE